MVQADKASFINLEREARREGIEKWPYPAMEWWMDQVAEALFRHADLALNIRVPADPDPSWDAQAYIHALIREWELYRVHFPLPVRLSVLWMNAGFASLESPLRWKELLEVLRRSLSNWSVGMKVLELYPGTGTEDQIFRLGELGFRHLRLNLLEDAAALGSKTGYEQALHLVQQARRMGYTSARALCALDHLSLATRPQEQLSRLANLRPDAVEWPDWLSSRPDTDALRKLVREALLPLGYEQLAPGCFALSHDPLYKAAETGDLSFGLSGYSPRFARLTLGLGADALSDAWSALARNESSVPVYVEKIRQGTLALAEGLDIGEEAQIMRLHRDNLRSLGEIQWEDPAFQCPALWEALERLRPLEQQDLIERYAEKGLILTEKGRRAPERVMAAFTGQAFPE
jgi:oxygen-independent coproporphyrinogen-3 oxidase